MAHCVIEYSADIEKQVEPQVLVEAVHRAIEDSHIFNVDNIRTRAKPYAHYQVGNSNYDHITFIHITLRILHGHKPQEKDDLAIDIVEILQLFDIKHVMISCEILEMENSSYSRIYVN